MKNMPVLELRNFSVHYETSRGTAKAANDINVSVNRGERIGLVGESGCGKTTTILGILRLIKYPGKIKRGEIILDGQTDLVKLTEKQMRKIRFKEISFIPQGAMNSLNPVERIGRQISEIFRYHGLKFSKKQEERDKITKLLSFVGLKASVANVFPHELSGGMKQRVCIAMSISLEPKVIIADEPTSALDVVVQRHVMATLETAQKKLNASVILIGHDMGLMAQFVDTVVIMYAGRVIEMAPVTDIFGSPLHPYTRFLINSIPSIEKKGLFKGIPGIAPSLLEPPLGCAFHPRCAYAEERCLEKTPELLQIGPQKHVACYLWEEKQA